MILIANKASIKVVEKELFTVGMYNAVKCSFQFSADWDDLSRTAVFTCGSVSRDVIIGNDNTAPVPHECLVDANLGKPIKVGVYGTDANGSVIIPTIVCTIGEVLKGADPTGDPSMPPTPTVAEQIFADNALTRQQAGASATAAAQSASDAASSASAASSAATAAGASASAAQGSATSASQSAQNAGTAAGTATSAAASATSAKEAAESASTAANQSKDAAATSASAAQTSASNAATSASAASSSATDANTAKEAAVSAKGAAETAKAAAETAKNDAVTAKGAAETAMSGAQTAAQNASTYATNAGNSASTASTKASEAANSASSASQSATSAAQSADSILGLLASTPASGKVPQYNSNGNIKTSAPVDANDCARIKDLDDTKWPLAYLKMGMAMKDIMKLWFQTHGAAAMQDYAQITEDFFKVFPEGKDYKSRFTQYDTSPAATGEKLGDNAGLTCAPSSNTVAGRDDYSNLALFAPMDCNYEIDATTLECKILAIKDVWGTFDPTGTDGMVGVIQMGAWVKREDTETHFTWHYADSQLDSDFRPLPECVKAFDNTFRSYMIHAKYAAGLDSTGKMTSGSGIMIRNKDVSHNSQITLWRARGAAYSGFSIADAFFRQLMIMIKYGTLSNEDAGLMGCVNYSLEYHPALAETNVERVLVTTAQAANLIVGSTVQLSTTSRGGTVTVNMKRISSIETVTVDGATYGAVNIDNGGVKFDTNTELFFNTMPWGSGSTDDVLGNDGAAVLGNDDYPVKIQGIECMVGAYEVAADVICNLANNKITYEVCRRAAKITTSVSTDYEACGFTTPQPASAGWQYPKSRGYDPSCIECSLLPEENGGTSSVREKDGFYMEAAGTTALRELLLFGALRNGGNAGFACGYADYGLADAAWYLAGRASGTSGNRGEWAA